MTFEAARVQRKAPLRFTVRTASQSSSFIRRRRPSRVIPALFTRISTRPNVSTARSIIRSESAVTVTLPWTASASPPVDLISAASASTPSGAMSTATILAPSAARARAMLRPIPRDAPVTMATFPFGIHCLLSFLHKLVTSGTRTREVKTETGSVECLNGS